MSALPGAGSRGPGHKVRPCLLQEPTTRAKGAAGGWPGVGVLSGAGGSCPDQLSPCWPSSHPIWTAQLKPRGTGGPEQPGTPGGGGDHPQGLEPPTPLTLDTQFLLNRISSPHTLAPDCQAPEVDPSHLQTLGPSPQGVIVPTLPNRHPRVEHQGPGPLSCELRSCARMKGQGSRWGPLGQGWQRAWPQTLQGGAGSQLGQRAGWGGKEDPEERRERTKWERSGRGEGSESPRPEETPGHHTGRGRGSPGGGGRSPGPAERSSREGGEEGAETQGGGETNWRDRGGDIKQKEVKQTERDGVGDATDTETLSVQRCRELGGEKQRKDEPKAEWREGKTEARPRRWSVQQTEGGKVGERGPGADETNTQREGDSPRQGRQAQERHADRLSQDGQEPERHRGRW